MRKLLTTSGSYVFQSKKRGVLRPSAVANSLAIAQKQIFAVAPPTQWQKRNNYKGYHNQKQEGFWDILKQEMKQEMEKDGAVQKTLKDIQDANTVKAAKKTSEVLKGAVETVSDNVVKPVADTISKGSEVLSEGVSKIAESQPVKVIGKAVETVAESKVVKVVVDEFTEELREKRKEHYTFRSNYGRQKLAEQGLVYNPYTERIEKIDEQVANTEATGITTELKKPVKPKTSFDKVKDALDLAVQQVENSKNPIHKVSKLFMSSVSTVVDFMGKKVFKPTEASEVLSVIKHRDPTFNLEKFLGNVEHIVIPKVLGAYFKDDAETIKQFVSEKCWADAFRPRVQGRRGDKIGYDTKILDIRDVDLLAARFEGDLPMLIISSHVQYIHCIRDKFGAGEIVEGSEKDIRLESQLWVFVQDQSGETKDWEILEVSFGSSVQIV